MKKSLFVPIAVGGLVVLFVVAAMLTNRGGVAIPRSDIERFLGLTLREKWHPPSYEAIFDENREYGFSSFSAIYSNNYFDNWIVDNCYFLAIVGYSKPTIYTPYEGKSLGFVLYVAVPYPDLKGKELAKKFLKDVPEENWKHAGPENLPWGPPTRRTEISAVWWQKGELRYLLSVVIIENYPGAYGDLDMPANIRTGEKAGVIEYLVYTPYEPDYEEVETYLWANLHGWGGENIREDDP